MKLVVPADLGLEHGVGVFEVGDCFVGQEACESFLEGVEAAFDLAFGGGDTMGGEGALEWGMGVEPVGWGVMAEEREAVGVEAIRPTLGFEILTQMLEMVPGCAAAEERAGDNFV